VPSRPADNDELKFPNQFEEGTHRTERVRGSLPMLPSVGLGPDVPNEAQDPAWDPMKSGKDDTNLPDKPMTWRRRLKWPGLAVVCGLLLLVAAFFMIDQSDDGGAAAPTPNVNATTGVQLAPLTASPTGD
jgi:hypothetical protein